MDSRRRCDKKYSFWPVQTFISAKGVYATANSVQLLFGRNSVSGVLRGVSLLVQLSKEVTKETSIFLARPASLCLNCQFSFLYFVLNIVASLLDLYVSFFSAGFFGPRQRATVSSFGVCCVGTWTAPTWQQPPTMSLCLWKTSSQ